MGTMSVPRGSAEKVRPHFLGVAIAAGACCLSLFAADSASVSITPRPLPNTVLSTRTSANLRLDVKLVLVPVSVTDATDRPVITLPRDRFRVLEDGVEQAITSFSREEGPVSMGILFDSSGSMKDRVDTSVAALREFFPTSIPGDEFFVIQFSDQARVLAGFTPEPREIFSKLGLVQPKGWTALLDAIALGTHEMRLAKNSRRVLLILSDGADNNSRFSESEIKTMVLESDLRIYAIGLFHRPKLLQQLADETGGKALLVQNLSELPEVVEKLSAEIRSHYVIGYSSNTPPNDGKYHKLKVELIQNTPLPLRLSWRRGYYAPLE